MGGSCSVATDVVPMRIEPQIKPEPNPGIQRYELKTQPKARDDFNESPTSNGLRVRVGRSPRSEHKSSRLRHRSSSPREKCETGSPRTVHFAEEKRVKPIPAIPPFSCASSGSVTTMCGVITSENNITMIDMSEVISPLTPLVESKLVEKVLIETRLVDDEEGSLRFHKSLHIPFTSQPRSTPPASRHLAPPPPSAGPSVVRATLKRRTR
jgi:hypothetical protein